MKINSGSLTGRKNNKEELNSSFNGYLFNGFNLILAALILAIALPVQAQQRNENKELFQSNNRPKLVVGIVVDQMRYDYLPRFWSNFGKNGFKRLVKHGYLFTNYYLNYFPTFTAPGHASIYTGATPSAHGIVGNSWYVRGLNHSVVSVADSTVQGVGGKVPPRSPVKLKCTTITDELKQSIPQSKVISVSIKPRAAILPVGHLADGAYWYDVKKGNFVTSTWYKSKLPQWVKDFNERNLAQQYSRQTWKLLLNIKEYTAANGDDSPYEIAFDVTRKTFMTKKAVFPHPMDSSLSRIRTSPFGNTLINEFAKTAIASVSLGKDSSTDFLSISFSSTDYVGHRFGPNSIEVEDTYLRLDRTIANLLNYLDKKVGKGNYLVFLTADHGVGAVPAYLNDMNLPGGRFDSRSVVDSLKTYLATLYGKGKWVVAYTNHQVYLNHQLINKQDLRLKSMQEKVASFLLQFNGVANTLTSYALEHEKYGKGYQAMIQRGHYPKRSGDVYIHLSPGWQDIKLPLGTTHGSVYNYDTHVPLIFFGSNIPNGHTNNRAVVTQIAPTISAMLNISSPGCTNGSVLDFK